MTFINMPRPVYVCQCGNHAWTSLTHGYVTLVSPQDGHYLKERAWRAFFVKRKYRWKIYAVTSLRSIRLHRLILEITDANLHGDHIDNNSLDNRRPNLRAATRSQNAQNCSSHGDSTSKFRGVCRIKGFWHAQIYFDKKTKHLGDFVFEEDAARAYDAAARSYHGEFARLNFP